MMTNLVTDLNKIAERSAQQIDDNDAFAYFVDLIEDDDSVIDNKVDQIAKPIIDAIDCTQCANCCKNLDVYLTPDDAERITVIVPLDGIVEFEQAQAVDEWAKFKHQPCQFLNDNLCTIYDTRPDSCRQYPVFTPDFRWTIREVLDGVALCPIIFNVIEALKIEFGWRD